LRWRPISLPKESFVAEKIASTIEPIGLLGFRRRKHRDAIGSAGVGSRKSRTGRLSDLLAAPFLWREDQVVPPRTDPGP